MSASVTTTLDPVGRVVIPAEYRKALKIAPGSQVILVWDNGAVRITTHEDEVRRAQALIRKYIPANVSLVDDLLAERAEQASLESQK